MVGLALVHFAVVELKPVIAAGMSSLSICRTMFKNTYKNQVPCTCNDGCTQQDTIEEQDQMLQTAMTSFTPGFHQEGDCTRVRVDNAHFASVFYYLLVVSWAVVLFSCVVMFLVEAFKRRFSSVASGAYLVFTLELEHRCLYRVILRSWTVLFVVVFITGLVSMISHNVDFHLVWVIVQSEIIPIFVLLASMHHLLSPTNLKEFSAWDLEKMRQIRFRRSWSDIFVDSNDNLYHRIGGAIMEAERGEYSQLRGLLTQGGDVYDLIKAIDLPKLMPKEVEDKPLQPGPESKSVSEDTKRSL